MAFRLELRQEAIDSDSNSVRYGIHLQRGWSNSAAPVEKDQTVFTIVRRTRDPKKPIGYADIEHFGTALEYDEKVHVASPAVPKLKEAEKQNFRQVKITLDPKKPSGYADAEHYGHANEWVENVPVATHTSSFFGKETKSASQVTIERVIAALKEHKYRVTKTDDWTLAPGGYNPIELSFLVVSCEGANIKDKITEINAVLGEVCGTRNVIPHKHQTEESSYRAVV